MINNTNIYPATNYTLDHMVYSDNTTISPPPYIITTNTSYPTITSVDYSSIADYTGSFGNMKVDGELTFNGEKLSEIISEIRDALHLLKRDRSREEKYAELLAIAEEYTKTLNRIRAMEAVVGEDNIE